jgi:hypothetical protein
MSAIVLLLESESKISGSGKLALTDIRRLVFDRLNTGGKKLNAQELRNAQNPGPFNDAIIDLSRYRLFTDVFGIPAYTEKNPEEVYVNPVRQKNNLYNTMRDCELVLRYFALKDSENIRGSMKAMLDRAMDLRLTSDQAEIAKKEFREQFQFLYDLFRGKPFAVPLLDGREKVSAAIYDSAMVAANKNWSRRHEILANQERVNLRMSKALENSNEYEVLIGRGNTADSVKARIELLETILLAS